MDRKGILVRSALVVSAMAALPATAWADADTETRIRQLEALVREMQQQRAEQDKQIDVLTRELVAIEHEVI
ncbi:MAG TPA: hypothetical protein VN084_03985 [Methylophilaceae bacterium]|nr:hypothetical protein [Methylophilaceae bacterium]